MKQLILFMALTFVSTKAFSAEQYKPASSISEAIERIVKIIETKDIKVLVKKD